MAPRPSSRAYSGRRLSKSTFAGTEYQSLTGQWSANTFRLATDRRSRVREGLLCRTRKSVSSSGWNHRKMAQGTGHPIPGQRDHRRRPGIIGRRVEDVDQEPAVVRDRKSTRLNSSHGYISYAVFCLKKKKQQ